MATTSTSTAVAVIEPGVHRAGTARPGWVSGRLYRPDARGVRAGSASCLSRCSPKLRGSFPAGGIATPAAQQAFAMCSSAADTPAAASRRRIVTRRRTARRGPARRSGVRRSEPPRHIVPRRTTRDISRRYQCPQPHGRSCLMTSSSRTGLPGPATSACRTEPAGVVAAVVDADLRAQDAILVDPPLHPHADPEGS
jgi:hypothetical protein